MTESTFPFAGDEAADEAAPDRRKLAVVAGVGALVVAVLGYFVVMPALSGGESESTSLNIVRAPQSSAKKPAAKAAAKPAAPKAPVVPQSYSDVSARSNPFRPLWEPPAEAAPVAPVAPGTVPAGTTGSTGSTGYTAPTGTSGSSTSVTGQKVSLIGIVEKDGKTIAQTRVGEVVYQPTVGAVFATSYKLLAVSGKTATYLFGDEQFTLSVGQEVLK